MHDDDIEDDLNYQYSHEEEESGANDVFIHDKEIDDISPGDPLWEAL